MPHNVGYLALMSPENPEPTPNELSRRDQGALNRLLSLIPQLTDTQIANLNAEKLARYTNCNRRALTRILNLTPDSSFARLKMRLRLELAARLLTTTDLKVSAIARRAGFSQLAVFCSYFKRHHQKTPTQWRDSA
ncbi:MAG: helix-turn-helix domain-containing protein [Limisphaerales bacterium]|jgi:transcriptional regulator GlxA family with amidase domain